MAFHASNDRIYITDTNGAVVFDTNRDIPHILTVVEADIAKVFYEKYYTEEYITLATLPADADFIICRAVCTPYNLEGVVYDPNDLAGSGKTGGAAGHGAYEFIEERGKVTPSEIIDWSVLTPGGGAFFQGSLPLEMGQQMVWQGGGYAVAQYARRILHVYVEPTWGNKLVAMFQQSVKSGFGEVSTQIESAPLDIWQSTGGDRQIYSRGWGGMGSDGQTKHGVILNTWPTTRFGQVVNVQKVKESSSGSWVMRTYNRVNPIFGPGAVRWEIKLKVWAGKFRA